MNTYSELSIITSRDRIIKENIKSLITESVDGKIEILPNYTNSIIYTIETTTILTDVAGKKKKILTSEGILYVNNNIVKFCCDSASILSDIG